MLFRSLIEMFMQINSIVLSNISVIVHISPNPRVGEDKKDIKIGVSSEKGVQILILKK